MENGELEHTTLRHRNSIAASMKLTLPSTNGNTTTATLPIDLELTSLKNNNHNHNHNNSLSFSSSYTSLKDLLPSSAPNSPTAASAAAAAASVASPRGSLYEISIRNRLVKQAAWAYLQPMSSSPDASSTHFLHRFWLRFCARNPIVGFFSYVNDRIVSAVSGIFDWILRRISVLVRR